jgi:two-component system chemotaxis response regulator CheY
VCRTILICDDAKFMRMMIAQTVTAAGYEVVAEAETGAEAVALYRQHRPTVVTMDMVMPELSGIDAVRQIVEADPQACIIMCSAMGQDALVSEAMKAGARGYVVKPFRAENLLTEVEEALARG